METVLRIPSLGCLILVGRYFTWCDYGVLVYFCLNLGGGTTVLVLDSSLEFLPNVNSVCDFQVVVHLRSLFKDEDEGDNIIQNVIGDPLSINGQTLLMLLLAQRQHMLDL